MHLLKKMALEKCSIISYMLWGVSPPPLWLPRCDNSRTGATSSSLSAGAAWGDRHCPLLSSYQHLEFHSNGKGIHERYTLFIIFAESVTHVVSTKP